MARSSVHHPIFARMYERMNELAERKGAVEHRAELLEGLAGRVLEIGAGIGSNFSRYPPTVTEVVATEPEPHLRAKAERAAREASVPITVVDATAESLPFDDGSFDATIASLVLCSVRDPEQALRELYRVTRPGGELRFYEHIRSTNPRLARLQRRVDLVWPWFGGGCHTSRATDEAIVAAGFVVERRRYFDFRPCATAYFVAPHVIGVARRPATDR